ncbi:LysM peptidoglycan-binding domain-containing protein [Entomomonas sp. E2T0]|uniref:LysM peptidoglycan-binding domain-containing protein n=1 Tax=Entomomonas sp. E2T0 TaxID=2930213 RepID=UPI0022284CE5|nr:LysM peptidoglycan-binding domain-containing protein [Entomomonas sp. E2T0]UYZ84920.1 LysM peptidoglycan-binding domain-containing protein [Entomomonas sp. E2T0]
MVGLINVFKSNIACKTILLISTLVLMFSAGCSSQKDQLSNNNAVALSQDKHIILKRGTVIQQSFYGDDLWQRVRNGFQLQNEYLGANNSRIDQQQRLLTSNIKSTERLFAKGSPYLHYIVEQLEARNMPLELALLPAVESAYNPTAYSNMKAAGLWQFMPRTGTHFNLQQTRWYDGRLDIIASTNAALDYLQYLHNMFNDWPLALAAYNSGEGTVRRAIQQNQKLNRPTDYWNLSLPNETIHYVPKLLALSKIAFSPDNYQVNLAPIPNQPYFNKIEINHQIKLDTVASLIGVDSQELQNLNAGLKAQAVINNECPKQLLVPAHKAAIFSDLLATGSIPNENISLWNNYNIRSGDTLGSIAARHNTTVNELRSINKLANNQMLRAGQQLKVPMVASTSTSSNSSEQPLRTIVLKDNRKYTIQAGDNLWSISQKNNIKLERLLELNQLSANASIKPGQQLYLTDRN